MTSLKGGGNGSGKREGFIISMKFFWPSRSLVCAVTSIMRNRRDRSYTVCEYPYDYNGSRAPCFS